MAEEQGFNMVEFPQSPERMGPACGHALDEIVNGRVLHDGDPALAAHVNGAARREGERGFTLSKSKSKGHIDGAVSLVMLLWTLASPRTRRRRQRPARDDDRRWKRMTAVTLPERVAARRAVQVNPVQVLLSVLAAPFFALGWLIGGVVSGVLWVCAAVALGFDAGRGRPGDLS